MSDVISNPAHYTEGRKYEPRKVIEDWNLDFYLGNALKYISRAGRKDDVIQDLRKAKQYIDFEIEKLERNMPNVIDDIEFATLPYKLQDGCMVVSCDTSSNGIE